MRKLIFILLFIPFICKAETYYVATDGSDSNNGTSLVTPFLTWQKGINEAYPGDTIFIRGGIYYITGYDNWVSVNPNASPAKGRNGTATDKIYFWAYPSDFEDGNKPILDCKDAYNTSYTNFSAISFNNVQYWYIKGITVRNVYQREGPNPPGTYNYKMPQGISSSTSANLIYENCTVYNIGGRGFWHFSGAWNIWDGSVAPWTSDTTRFINCDAYNLCDSLSYNPGNAADGWKCQNYIGNVLIWDGCRAWNYSDDGFDPSGSGKRIFRNCWAMSTSKFIEFGIEGNGFKTAAVHATQEGHYDSTTIFVEMTNCLAAYCKGRGAYNNLELGLENKAIYENNTFYRNWIGLFDMPLYTDSRKIECRNNLSYANTGENYEQIGIYRPSVYTESNNTWIATQKVSDWPGWTYNPAVSVSDADFVSLDSSQIRLPRKPDGSLPDITFMKLASTSDLINSGVYVDLPFNGAAPDIGYAEYGVPDEPEDPVVYAEVSIYKPRWLTNTTAWSGGNVTHDGGGTITARGIVWNTDGSSPDIAVDDYQAAASGGTGTYTVTMTGLTRGVNYYVWAYASNEAGIDYSDNYMTFRKQHLISGTDILVKGAKKLTVD